MIDALGWFCTVLVLVGYLDNARGFQKAAMITWIVGDIGWIIYDIYINNISHLVLCIVIITINIYGLFQISKKQRNKCIKQ